MVKEINGVSYETEPIDQKIVYPKLAGSPGVKMDVPYTSYSPYFGLNQGQKFYIDLLPSGFIQYFKIIGGNRYDFGPKKIGAGPYSMVMGYSLPVAPPHKSTDAELAQAAQTQQGGESNNLTAAIQSLAHQATHPLETLKNVVDNVVTASQKVLTKAEEAAIFLALWPFKSLMIEQLTDRGIKIDNSASMKAVAVLFAMNVIKGRFHLENLGDADGSAIAMDPPADPVINGLVTSGATEGLAVAGSAELDIPPDVSKNLAKMIIDFFKKLISKKKDKTLPKDLQKIADQAAPVQDQLAIVGGGEDSNGNIHAVDSKGNYLGYVSSDSDIIPMPPPHHLNLLQRALPGLFRKKHPEWYETPVTDADWDNLIKKANENSVKTAKDNPFVKPKDSAKDAFKKSVTRSEYNALLMFFDTFSKDEKTTFDNMGPEKTKLVKSAIAKIF